MKNKILSFTGRGLAGCSTNIPEITRKSPGNHAVITRFWKVITMVVFLFTFAIGNVWAAETVLFNQSFDETGAGSVAYAISTARAYTTAEGKTLAKVVETGTNYFTSITCNSKDKAGIGVNNSTGGNSKNYTGKFGAYYNNTSGYWSICKTSNFAATAPTAIMVEMNIAFNYVSSGSGNIGAQIAVGSGFADGLTNNCPGLDKCVAGFSWPSNSSIKISKYVASSAVNNLSTNTITAGTSYKYTWIINNTTETLDYTGPDNKSTTVAAGCWDLWVGTTLYCNDISKTTTGMSGTALQNIYIGSPFGKKHEFILEDIKVTDLSPCVAPSITSQPSNASLAIGDANPELSVSANNTTSYAWKESSNGTSYDGTSSLATTASFTPSVNDKAQTKYYYCELVNSCNTSNVVKTNIVTVEVVSSTTPVTGVSLDITSQEFTLGGTVDATLTATVAPNEATNKNISWESDKPLIVSVTDNGDGTADIKGLAEGTATITVTTQDGSFTATCNVTVNPDPCATYFWFFSEADQTANGKTNATSVFSNMASGGSNMNGSITIDEVTYNVTRRTGDADPLGGFTVPANKAATFYTLAVSSGDGARKIVLTNNATSATYEADVEGGSGSYKRVQIDNIAPGTYTIGKSGGNTRLGMVAVKACDAEFHTITLRYNDGVTPNGTINALDGAAATKPADPTRGKYTFLGWKNGANDYNWSSVVTGDLTLDAQWQDPWTITFDADGGSAVGDITAKHNTKAEKPADPTKDDYEFDGWYIDDTDNAFDWDANVTANYSLKAHWLETIAKYDIEYYDGDTKIGTELQVRADQHPTATGIETAKPLYTFVGWYLSSTLEGDPVNLNTVTPSEGLKIYGKWEKVYSTSIDFETLAATHGTGTTGVASELAAKNYVFSGSISTDNGASWDAATAAKPADKGLKIKGANGKTLSFSVAAGKLVTLKVGSLKGGATIAVNGGSAVTLTGANPLSTGASVYTYYYSADEANYSIATTGTDYDVIQSVKIEDPYEVIYDATDGECATTSAMYIGEELTLPTPTHATYIFKGWFDAATEGTLIGAAGAKYTPTASITLYAQWETVSSDNTLSALEVDGVALADFAPDKHIYNIVCEYGHTPQITLATATAAAQGATVAISNTPVHYVDADNDFWYVQANVTPASGTPIGYNQVRYTNKPKQGATIFKAELTAANDADYSGLYADEANSQIALTEDPDNNNEYKFSGKSNFIKMAIADAAFAEGDILKMTYTTNPQQGELAIYDGTTKLQGTPYTNNTLTFSDAVGTDKSTLYIRRTDDNKFNAWVAAVEVQRYMDPFIASFKIGEVSGTIDQDLKTIAIELPFGTSLYGVAATIEAYANGGATVIAPTPLAYDTPLGYKVSSAYAEDGDVDYTVTITEAEHYEAMIGDVGYATLVDAVAAAQDGDIVVLQENVTAGAGVMIAKADAKQITIDFGGYTYKAVAPAVGSAGTQNQAFHFEKGCDITLKNGTITSEGSVIKMLIQNYGNLTLENITLDGTGLEGSHRYVMSNNCGDVVIGNGTTITAKDGDVAFDVCATNYYPEGVKVTVEAGATVNGIVEYDVWGTKPADNKAELAIEGGTLNITWNVESALAEDAKANLNVSGGQFSEVVPADYCAEGYAPVTTPNAQGKYEVQDVRVVIFDGSTMSDMAASPSGAISWAKVGSTMSATDKSATYDEVSYTKALQLGNSSTTKHFRIDVEENTNAKIEVIGMSNSNSGDSKIRHAWLTNSTEKGEYANAIAGLESDGYNPAEFETEWLEEGSYYLHADNTVNIFLIRVTPKAVPAKCEVPTITTQPATKLDFGAGNLTATVVATVEDGGMLKYQWYNAADDSKVVGATEATLSTADEGTYYVIVTNTLADHRDNSIKSAEATLAHRVMDDATLSVLKYGTTAIALEADKYEYRVDLAENTTEVPALSATATMDGYATVTIHDAAAFVEYEATSTVDVTSEDGTANKTYTVHFYVDHEILNLVDVTGNMKWDFSKANDGSAATSSMCNEAILANVDGIVNNDDFESDNIMATANKFASGKLQASMIKFHTTVPGSVIVKCANTSGNKPMRYLYVNGIQTELGSTNGTVQTYAEYVPAGDVVLTVMPTTETGTVMFNFTSVEFKVDKEASLARTDSWMAPGEMGTICIPQGAVAVGADIYTIVGREPQHGKVVMETIKHMKPGKPYMFVAQSDRIDFIVTDETPAENPDNNSGAMKGTFSEITLTGAALDGVYYFAGKALWSCVDLTESGLHVSANRAYVKLSEINYLDANQQSPAPGRRRISMAVNGEQVATGMESIQPSEISVQKVMINGQLFILRGEKKYDVTGKLVK